MDFEVWKALTLRRRDESHSYNDVLRELLGLDPLLETGHRTSAGDGASPRLGRLVGDRFLPNGSKLRAKYKGVLYHAEIVNGTLIDGDGKAHSSSSAAARAVTKTNVNGLTFWEVRRPGESGWNKIASLPKARQ